MNYSSKQEKGELKTELKIYPIFFILSKHHPPSPDALRNPGLVDVVRRVSGRTRIAPRDGVTAVGRRSWNKAESTGG